MYDKLDLSKLFNLIRKSTYYSDPAELSQHVEYTFHLSKFMPHGVVYVFENDFNEFFVACSTVLTDNLILIAISNYIKHRNEVGYTKASRLLSGTWEPVWENDERERQIQIPYGLTPQRSSGNRS